MKNSLLPLVMACSLAACDSSQQQNTASGGEQQHKPLYNAVAQPLEQARDAEKQVFDSADRQKKQAEEM